jgi:tRNA 2-thiouridine synthesizing protein C
MSHSIALVNRHSPYGKNHAQASLDLLLAYVAMEQPISIFFMADGVYQLKTQQDGKLIVGKHFSAMFAALPLYDVAREQLIVAQEALQDRGLHASDLLVDCLILDNVELCRRLYQHHHIISL